MSDYIAKYKRTNIYERIIIYSFFIGLISLFFPWVKEGAIRRSGFKQLGFLLLVFYIYPLRNIYKEREYSSVIGSFLGILGLILAILLNTRQGLKASIGFYIFMLSKVLFIVGNLMNKKEIQHEILGLKERGKERAGESLDYGKLRKDRLKDGLSQNIEGTREDLRFKSEVARDKTKEKLDQAKEKLDLNLEENRGVVEDE